MKKNRVNWGLIGPGLIARKFAQDITLVKDASLIAVASSDPGRARNFAKDFQIPKACSSYGDLLSDPDVDGVYIATIHPTHYGIARDALNAGKHVLIEKPMTMNSLQARTLMDLARSKKLFLMEAMWTAFLPVTRAVLQLVRSGKLGSITKVEGSFSIGVTEAEAERLYNPALGGGALLDLGIYPLSYAHMVMGSGSSEFISEMNFTSKGVDESTRVKLTYGSGATAELSCHMAQKGPIQFQIHGEKGSVLVPHFLGANCYKVQWEHGEAETYSLPFRGEGFVEQIEGAGQSILEGHLENQFWSHKDSLSVMTLMDAVRKTHNLQYPGWEQI